MDFNYITYTLQVHDCLLELGNILQACNALPRIVAWQENIRNLDKKLETMHFQVAVVGEFKRGKTSFINALLRKAILPADVAPTTATINRITYGDMPASYIQWNDGRPMEKVEIDRLSDYITKLTESSAAQANKIKEAVVRYPCRFCEHSVDLIDTPGMNDDDDMNSVTIRGLSDIDLAIVTLEPDSPVSNTEAHFIAKLVENDQICQIIFVLSKMDTVDEDERDVLIRGIKNRIRERVRAVLLETHEVQDAVMKKYDALFSEIILFPVSARQALSAYEIGDKRALEESGFRRLNDELLPLIIRNQHSAAILTPLHTIQTISREFETLLQGQREQMTARKDIDAVKAVFAKTAYGLQTDYGSVWNVCASELDRQGQGRMAAVIDAMLGSVRSIPLSNISMRASALTAQMKGFFRQLSTELTGEESLFYHHVWNQYLHPAYGRLGQSLAEILQKHAMFFDELKVSLDKLTDPNLYLEALPAPESFYWKKSPIPPPTMLRNHQQTGFVVRDAVQASFKDYYERRKSNLSQFLKEIRQAQEKRVEALVQLFFGLVNKRVVSETCVIPDQAQVEQFTGRIGRLEERCCAIERKYLQYIK